MQRFLSVFKHNFELNCSQHEIICEKCCQLQNVKSKFIAGDAKKKLFPILIFSPINLIGISFEIEKYEPDFGC